MLLALCIAATVAVARGRNAIHGRTRYQPCCSHGGRYGAVVARPIAAGAADASACIPCDSGTYSNASGTRRGPTCSACAGDVPLVCMHMRIYWNKVQQGTRDIFNADNKVALLFNVVNPDTFK